MTYDEIRIAVMTYVEAAVEASAYAADPYRVFYPSDGLPGPEDNPNPFIVIGLELNQGNRQMQMGSRATEKTGFITLRLQVRTGTGIKEISKFEDWCDTMRLKTESSVVYELPVTGGPETELEGWTQVRRILPFKVQCI